MDHLVEHLDRHSDLEFRIREFTPTSGSDERQYCSPGFDLPVGQMARTLYGEYDAYHTSNDDKAFMGIDTLVETAEIIGDVLEQFEYAGTYCNLEPFGEPMLSKRDLYTDINSPDTWSDSTDALREDEGEFTDKVLTILNCSDGEHTMVEIADSYGCQVSEFWPAIVRLLEEGLLDYDQGS